MLRIQRHRNFFLDIRDRIAFSRKRSKKLFTLNRTVYQANAGGKNMFRQNLYVTLFFVGEEGDVEK